VVPRGPQRVHDAPDLLDAAEAPQRAGHHVADGELPHVRLGVAVEVRQALEAQDEVVDAGVEGVGDRLGDEQHEHDEREEEQVVGELEDDDAHGHRHPERPAEEGRGAEDGDEAVVEAGPAAEQHGDEAAVGGAGEDDGDEETRRRHHAVAQHAERVRRHEEDGHGRRVVHVVGARGVEVADGVVVDVEEQAGEVVVVPRRAVEPPETVQRVARPVRRR